MVIEAESLIKQYEGKDIIRDISFSINSGEIFGLIGPSGSGKSTLIRLLDLLEMPTGGRLSIFGTDALASRSRFDLRRRMALLNQKPVIFGMSVHDNIALGMKYRGESRQEIDNAVHDALEAIGLHGYGRRMARTLSGGEAQRVALARSIVTRPEILFLDEPTANLDPISAEKIEELVLQINRELHTTIVISTHDMLQGQKLANRIGVILDGKIPQIGTTNEIFHRPATTSIARFVRVENIIPGSITENRNGEATISTPGITIEAVTIWIPAARLLSFSGQKTLLSTSKRLQKPVRGICSGEKSRALPRQGRLLMSSLTAAWISQPSLLSGLPRTLALVLEKRYGFP